MAIAKKVYDITHDRGYELGFIGGGVRQLHHFTEMVGGDVCITMNWEGSCDALIQEDHPVVSRMFNPVQQIVLDELQSKLPQFRQAYWENGLSVDEYETYGAVEYFRDIFIRAWKKALEVIAEERGR
jgi:transaldolase